MKLKTQRKAMITRMLAGLASGSALVATLPLALTASVALAQESAKADAIETIVVTARRREEPLQQVPAAITTFTAQQIEDIGIRTIQDFANLTPNLSFRERYRPGAVSVSMRGITNVPQGEAPVSIVVDGVHVPGLDFINQQLLDIESIQVLRGPQGALYGHGAVGGAILINTKQPGNNLEAAGRLSYGNGKDARFTGTVSGPIAKDKVFFSVSASTVNRDGFRFNQGIGGNEDTQSEQTFSGHLKALLSDNLTLDIRAKHTDGKMGVDDSPARSTANYLDLSILPNFNVRSIDHRTLDEQSVALRYKTSAGTLSAVTGFSKSTSVHTGDGDRSPTDFFLLTCDCNPIRAWSQDVRFASPDNQPLRWVVGAFYQDRKVGELISLAPSPTSKLPFPFGPVPSVTLAQDDKNAKATAVYGQLIYALTGKTEIEGALRQDQDKRSISDTLARTYAETKFSQTQPKVSLKHNWSDRLMTYASYGQGFRSGGFNSAAAMAVLGAKRIYPAEVSNTFEMGFKSQTTDRRVTVNAAAFNIDFKDQQYFNSDLATGTIGWFSMNKSSINGFEIEVTARPARGLELTASAGIADAVIKNADGKGLWAGKKTPNAYASNMILSAQYVHPVSDNKTLMARIDYERKGKIYFDNANQYPFPETSFVDARLFLEMGKHSIGFYGKNLTNQAAPVDVNFVAPGVVAVQRNLPRQFGIEANLKF